MATISVIIPCHNQAVYLADAIESALAQTVADVEVVVVDDGSTDGTREVAARYPVQYVRREGDGVARARNTGASASRGTHLIFLDADDLLLPRAAEAALHVFEAHPGTALVRGYHDDLTADGVRLRVAFPPSPRELDYEAVLSLAHNIAMPAEAMFLRGPFEAVGGFEKRHPGVEDLDLYLRIARRFPPIRVHDEVIAVYRRHPASMSRRSAQMLRSSHALFAAQLPLVRGNRRLMRAHRVGLERLSVHYTAQLVDQLRAAARRGQTREVAAGTLALLRYSPRELAQNAGRKLRATLTARAAQPGTAGPAAPATSPDEAP